MKRKNLLFLLLLSIFFSRVDAQIVKQKAAHLYTSPNARQGNTIEDMMKVNYATLFKPEADLTGGIKAHVEPGGTVKLKVFSFDKTASNGYGNLIYGCVLTASSENEYAGETWTENAQFSGWNISFASTNIKKLSQAADLYFSPDCSPYALDPVNAFYEYLHMFDGIGGSLVPGSCASAFQPAIQPVIIQFDIYNAVVKAVKIPGIGEFAAPVQPDQFFAIVADYGCDRIGNDFLPASPPTENWEPQVAALVKSWNPEYLISLGDDNYADQGVAGKQNCSVDMDENIGKYYQEYIYNYHGRFGLGSPTRRFFPIPGNHDYIYPIQKWLDYFDNPSGPGNERYYEFQKGNVHFFATDNNPYDPQADPNTKTFNFNFIPDLNVNGTRATWLKNSLAALQPNSNSYMDITLLTCL